MNKTNIEKLKKEFMQLTIQNRKIMDRMKEIIIELEKELGVK